VLSVDRLTQLRSEEELALSIEDVIAELATATAADAEAAGIEAGESAEELPNRPEVGDELRADLARELVSLAVIAGAGWAASRVVAMLPRVVAWWLARRAQRQPELPPENQRLTPEDATAKLRTTFHLERRLAAAMVEAANPRAVSQETVDELQRLRRRFGELREGDPPEYLVHTLDVSLANVEEWLARAHESLSEYELARAQYETAARAWDQLGDKQAAARCRATVERPEA